MNIPSLLRIAENRTLSRISLSGRVLDLGGDSRSGYQHLFDGDYTMATVNADVQAHPDMVHDLEQPLPIEDGSYNHVLLINVLEHIYNYKQLLFEAVRVLKPGGTLVIVVPFLFPLHPSPHDYRRFSAESLKRECQDAGLRDSEIMALGSGVFSVQHLCIDRLMPLSIRFVNHYLTRHLTSASDAIFTKVARSMGRKYNPADYALGYIVTATK